MKLFHLKIICVPIFSFTLLKVSLSKFTWSCVSGFLQSPKNVIPEAVSLVPDPKPCETTFELGWSLLWSCVEPDHDEDDNFDDNHHLSLHISTSYLSSPSSPSTTSSSPSSSSSPFRSSCFSSSKTQWSTDRSGRLFARARFPDVQTSSWWWRWWWSSCEKYDRNDDNHHTNQDAEHPVLALEWGPQLVRLVTHRLSDDYHDYHDYHDVHVDVD